jgi:hypothetical protein
VGVPAGVLHTPHIWARNKSEPPSGGLFYDRVYICPGATKFALQTLALFCGRGTALKVLHASALRIHGFSDYPHRLRSIFQGLTLIFHRVLGKRFVSQCLIDQWIGSLHDLRTRLLSELP